MSLRSNHCHEMGVRIVLSSLASHAARYKRYIVPYMSCHIDFYTRVFVRVYTSAAEVKHACSKVSMVYNCTGCTAFHLQSVGKSIQNGRSLKFKPTIGPPIGPNCEECGRTFHVGGPIWSHPLHNMEFVNGLLGYVQENKEKYGTYERMNGLLSVVSEELNDCPLYYTPAGICSTIKCTQPSMIQVRSAFIRAGYRISISHTSQNAIKTDAPPHVVWDIFRCWAKEHKEKPAKEGTTAFAILAKEPKIKASFEELEEANPESRKAGTVRFPELPANWGPKSRAKKKHIEADEVSAEAANETADAADGSDAGGEKRKRAKTDAQN